jgi:hypothetical protein
LDIHLDKNLAIYPGVTVKTSTWTGISDPGWADYGITPDFFARVPIAKALNPLPIDANRAVNGLSSQRKLSDVAEQIQAQGPLNTFNKQNILTIDAATRAKINKTAEIENNFKFLIESAFGSAALSCANLFQ